MRKIYALIVNVKKTLRQFFAAFENGIPCFRERNWKTSATSLTNNLIPEYIPQQKLSQMQMFTNTTKTFNGLNRWMMILITGLFVMLGSVNTNAQTTLISPTGDGGFETGATMALNNWTAVNHTTNTWQVGAAATAFAGARSAFVSNDGGTTYAYTNSVSQTSDRKSVV